MLKFTGFVPFDKLKFSLDVAIDRLSVVVWIVRLLISDAVFKLSLIASVVKLSVVCASDGLLVAVAVFRVLTDISLFTISVVAVGVKRELIN